LRAFRIPKGGVLLALLSLLAVGLLRYATALYQLPKRFYGIARICWGSTASRKCGPYGGR
jgi:hypothetical protein